MTTTFHFETNEPQYEYSYEGADVQLRCQGLVAVAAGPAPALDENALRTWFEPLRSAESEYWQGLGEVCQVPPRHQRSKRERQFGRMPWRALPHPSSPKQAPPLLTVSMPWWTRPMGVVQLGRAGRGTSALIFDGSETRLVQSASSEVGVGHSTSFELSAGSTLLLLTHDPAEREVVDCRHSRELLPLVRYRVMRSTRSLSAASKCGMGH